MAGHSSFVSQLRKLLAEDPRTAIALLEILGPPPGLARTASQDSRARGASQS